MIFFNVQIRKGRRFFSVLVICFILIPIAGKGQYPLMMHLELMCSYEWLLIIE